MTKRYVKPCTLPPQRYRARGFTIAELLVAVAIGLLILAGMTTMFVNNSRAQAEIEKSNRQVENGRYAIDVLTTDLRNAGFYGEFDPTPLASPAALPDPCASTVAALVAALPLHVQGYDNGASLPACLTDVRAGTDVLVVRRTSTCVNGDPTCDTGSIQGPLFQASLCNNASELDSGNPATYFALDTDPSGLTRHQRDCTAAAGSGTLAASRRYLTHIYFVANNDKSGDGIPTLKRAELRLNAGVLGFTIVPLTEGVDNLQLEYGIDTNNDGVADLFSASPGSANACAQPACAVSNWRNVLSVKLNVLSRNTETTAGYTDRKAYVLGNKADGSENRIVAASDHYKRHVFQSTVPLPNPAGRKQP
jgi:type IV pilus assembly protein PilW